MCCYKYNKYYANLQQLQQQGNGIFVLLPEVNTKINCNLILLLIA
jgi:hypothetical protein